ncbi:tetratricopeptide repeat protein [Paucibacter sp. AS339]|uniref:ATP-binding protein n=1 Tax=Paucibacter hankyongi TaxID=3133434 RepID=UPI0030996D41
MNTFEAVSLLLLDIVDSAALAERLGDAAMVQLWTAHDRAARDLLRQWRGREIDKTDGFLLLFVQPSDALGFALAYHRALAGLSTPMRARAGLHVGPISVRENPPADVALGAKPIELDGLAKPVAARVMAAALGGQTLLTETAMRALGPVAQRLLSHGHWRLKGLPEPMELFEIGEEADGCAPFTPPPDSDKAYRVLRNRDVWMPVREVSHSLPAERDNFVGRHAAMLGLARLFEKGARLVSLLGMGGSGKTRLATHFGLSRLGDYPGGVWFCDLASARAIDGLVHAVAQGLDVPLGKADPVEQLGHAIAGRGNCLLILDNFEQVARFAEDSVGHWLDRAPEAHFLVTSRELLGIAGEEALVLPPLGGEEARDLFILRAKAARQDFAPDGPESQAIAELMRLLDGLPLAIELAAARARILPPSAMLVRMSERFKLLAGGGGRGERQSTLRGTFDWSWDLLAPAERAALAQLSVFEGGFSLAAAEVVIDVSAFADAPWPMDALASLVDKSFVRSLGADRFDLLVSVQVYADEHLRTEGRFLGSGPPALRAAQCRHGAWFAALGPEHAIDGDCADLENLVVGCRRAVDRQEVQTALGLLEGAWEALSLHGPFKSGLELAEQVASMAVLNDADRARVHLIQGRVAESVGRLVEARQHAEQALTLARQAGDSRSQAQAGLQLAQGLARQGHDELARAMLSDALSLARSQGDRAIECAVLNALGNLDHNVARPSESEAHYQAALRVAQQLPQQSWRGSVLGNLGILNMSLGRLELATEQLTEALQLARQLGDRKREGNTLCNLGLLHHTQGRLAEAVSVSEAARTIARELGYLRLECTVLCNLGIFHLAQAQESRALECLNAARSLARQLPDTRLEGQALTYLVALHGRQRAFELGRACAQEGQVLLQSVGDLSDLGLLFCFEAELAWLSGDARAAAVLLDRADTLAQQVKANPASELALALARTHALMT